MDNRVGFLQWILGKGTGFISIGFRHARTEAFEEHIFEYPKDLEEVSNFIQTRTAAGDLYFCPTILTDRKRIKANIQTANVAWSDLDECPADLLRVKPTVTIQTSPGRFQAFWMLNETQNALDVEVVNKRIAYTHEHQGADKSGWDLTQYLRIPGTQNFKRDVPKEVKVIEFIEENTYDLTDFAVYPEVKGLESAPVPFPEELPEQSGKELLESIKTTVSPRAWMMFAERPQKDWSKQLWQLELMLAEVGCSREEIFVVARDSACNKYARDHPTNADQLLWREVCKAYDNIQNRLLLVATENEAVGFDVKNVDILRPDEIQMAKHYNTIIDDYVAWAKTTGDAAPQYHIGGAFILLSSLIASSVRLPTSYGTVLPNLWFMILADTTLTRKTTAMDLAMEMITEIDSDIILATDGSIEGLMTTISARPNKASIFLRDEFSGLLDQMSKRDYYAGMQEAFTKLYDGKYQKRVLRKETIEVRDPVLVIFAGGIKTRIYEQIDSSHIVSGFLPRFLFIEAESDINRIRPLGPPTQDTITGRQALLSRFQSLYEFYKPEPVTVDNMFPESFDVSLTPEAWQLYNRIEHDMLEIGLSSNMADVMTPMMARLTTSGLKAAVLIAASGQRTKGEVIVDKLDLIKAFTYVNIWKNYSIKVVANSGRSFMEKRLEKVYEYIVEKGHHGALRSTLMQHFRLTAKDATAVFDTLEQRGLIHKSKTRGTTYFATSLTNIRKS